MGLMVFSRVFFENSDIVVLFVIRKGIFYFLVLVDGIGLLYFLFIFCVMFCSRWKLLFNEMNFKCFKLVVGLTYDMIAIKDFF